VLRESRLTWWFFEERGIAMEAKQLKTSSSLENSLRLLNLFSMDEPEFTLSELAEKFGVGYSTMHRLTTTLMHEGFLARDLATKKFRLGASILAAEKTIQSYYDICQISPPVLKKLVQNTGESAHLSILKDHKVVYLQKIESPNYAHLLSHEGKSNPVHATSTGQVLLAYQKQSVIENVIVGGLLPYTSQTITNPQKLLELLVKVRSQGYAYGKDEFHLKYSSIAAPVKSPSGKVDYAVSVAGPSSRITPHRVQELSKAVKEAADELALRNYGNKGVLRA
jgi:DNA-binding IclR family transcriptional regulator